MVQMRLLLFWDVTQCRLVVTDVTGQLVSPSFKSPAVFLDCLAIEDGTSKLS